MSIKSFLLDMRRVSMEEAVHSYNEKHAKLRSKLLNKLLNARKKALETKEATIEAKKALDEVITSCDSDVKKANEYIDQLNNR